MAERLPVGAARNKLPSFNSFGSSPASNDVSSVSIDRLNGQIDCQEPDSNVSNSQLLFNGSNTATNHSSGHNKQGHIEPVTKSGGRTKKGESRNENEEVEQYVPGVYITLTLLLGGAKDLKRVRFRFVLIYSLWKF